MCVMSYKPTPDELKRGVEHIVHDYATLVLTGEAIPTGKMGIPWNGPVEQSFLVNCRKFAHFFLNKGMRDKPDILSEHYLTSPKTFSLPTWGLWFDHHDKHLFHLSYARTGPSHRPWTGDPEDRDFFRELRSAWREFLLAHPLHEDEFNRWIEFKENQMAPYGVKLR